MARIALIAATTLALTFAPAQARAAASGGDGAATAAYLAANFKLVSFARSEQASSEATLRVLLARVRRECPKVAAGSPQDTASEQLTFELVGAMTLVAVKPNVRAIAGYTRAVAGLHWSNTKLTRAVSTYRGQLRRQSLMAPPDICADVRAWVASGYRTLPDSTRRFNRAFYSVYVAVGLLPTRLLAPSVAPAQRSLLQRTHQLELQLTDAEARAVTTWGQIMEALALNP
jgi:hypothetical protein